MPHGCPPIFAYAQHERLPVLGLVLVHGLERLVPDRTAQLRESYDAREDVPNVVLLARLVGEQVVDVFARRTTGADCSSLARHPDTSPPARARAPGTRRRRLLEVDRARDLRVHLAPPSSSSVTS